jgi:hypothetical protein
MCALVFILWGHLMMCLFDTEICQEHTYHALIFILGGHRQVPIWHYLPCPGIIIQSLAPQCAYWADLSLPWMIFHLEHLYGCPNYYFILWATPQCAYWDNLYHALIIYSIFGTSMCALDDISFGRHLSVPIGTIFTMP